MAKFLGALLLSLAIAAPAMAQNDIEVKVRYKRRTVINYGDHEIDGVVVGPGVISIGSRRVGHFSPMLALRINFTPELLGSSGDL